MVFGKTVFQTLAYVLLIIGDGDPSENKLRTTCVVGRLLVALTCVLVLTTKNK